MTLDILNILADRIPQTNAMIDQALKHSVTQRDAHEILSDKLIDLMELEAEAHALAYEINQQEGK